MPSAPLADTRLFVHRVDADGRIAFVNAAWLDFGAENGWPVSPARVIGATLSDFIADRETGHIYGLMIAKARAAGQTVSFGYRCDSPDCRRFMQMQVQYDAASGLVEFRSHVLRLEPRPAVALLGGGERSPASGVLALCGWCKCAQVGDQWIAVEEAVRRLGLFDHRQLPLLSHGICPHCLSALEAKGISP